MKNKGFTLVELLAVVIVLAIIVITTIPMILGTTEKSKKRTIIESGKNYIRAVEDQVSLSMVSNKIDEIKDGMYSISELKEDYDLSVKGKEPKDGNIIIEEGKVVECTLIIDEYELTCDDGNLVIGKSSLP